MLGVHARDVLANIAKEIGRHLSLGDVIQITIALLSVAVQILFAVI